MSREDLEEFGQELDGVRQRVLDDLGQNDADYIRRVIRVQRALEVLGRIGLFMPFFLPAFIAGIALLALAKIIENMEIGHNVMHGQYDWMNDPTINGKTYEWDIVVPGPDWKRTHNYVHHTYTNIHGMDKDIGYNLLRIDNGQPWYPNHRFNLPLAFVLMLIFEWGVMSHGVEYGDFRAGRISEEEFLGQKERAWRKIRRQLVKDYVAYPLLALPLVPFVGWWAPLAVLGGNFVANIIRNIWTFLVIFCGHFPAEVQTFEEEDAQGESRGQWYVRQLLGSANISGLQAVPRHDRQPEPPDRAPPVPGHPGPPLPADRAGGAGPDRDGAAWSTTPAGWAVSCSASAASSPCSDASRATRTSSATARNRRPCVAPSVKRPRVAPRPTRLQEWWRSDPDPLKLEERRPWP